MDVRRVLGFSSGVATLLSAFGEDGGRGRRRPIFSSTGNLPPPTNVSAFMVKYATVRGRKGATPRPVSSYRPYRREAAKLNRRAFKAAQRKLAREAAAGAS